MATLTTNLTVTLNGSTTVFVGGTPHEWSVDRFLFGIDFWVPWSSPSLTATVKLAGNDWGAAVLRFSGNAKAVITDASTGARFIEHISLNNAGGNKVTLANSTVGSITGSSGVDTITTGSQYVASILLGAGDDQITTGSGLIDIIETGTGNDIVKIGSGGAHRVLTGAGNDQVTTGSGLVDTIDAGSGNNIIKIGSGGADRVLAGKGIDQITLTGNAEVQYISSGGGNDTIVTAGGFVGTVNAGSGNNIVKIGKGGAHSVLAGEGNDQITLLTTAEADYISTGRGNDTITTGTGWVGTIDAGRGKDTVKLGAGGADTVQLGRDADTIVLKPLTDKEQLVVINGGSSVSTSADKDSDTIDFAAFSKALKIDLNGISFVESGNGNFLIRNFEHATGGKGADTITGNAKANILKGGAGNDKLTGDLGADQLYGGAGADHFIFRSVKDSTTAASGRDTIFDFSQSQKDKIDLSAIDANTKTSGDQAFSFIGNKAFSKKAGELRFEKTAADTYVYGDVNGDGKADFAIHIDLALTLKATDFLL